MKRADITIDKILSDYQFALDMAKAQEKPDSVVKAADSQAKIVGLLRERLETGQVGDFSDAESENEIINALTPEQRADLARLLIDAGEHQLAAQDLAEADPASDAVN